MPSVRFKSVSARVTPGPSNGDASADIFIQDFSTSVLARFERTTGLLAVIAPIELPGISGSMGPCSSPLHPVCREHKGTEVCIQTWQAHLQEIRDGAEAHFHRCTNGIWCAIVPLTWQHRTLAVCQLVCEQPLTEAEFERHVEMLELLTDQYLTSRHEWISRWLGGEAVRDAAVSDGKPLHPQVRAALEFIERNFSDPSVNVKRIARELSINATYLAHLFSEQMGMRMHRHIANKRIERAKKLLAETNWQIKRVAYESGHANADWFSQVFHAETGQTPSRYRRQMRHQAMRLSIAEGDGRSHHRY